MSERVRAILKRLAEIAESSVWIPGDGSETNRQEQMDELIVEMEQLKEELNRLDPDTAMAYRIVGAGSDEALKRLL